MRRFAFFVLAVVVAAVGCNQDNDHLEAEPESRPPVVPTPPPVGLEQNPGQPQPERPPEP